MARKDDKVKTLAGKRKLEKPDLKAIQQTYGKKVVMPNGQVLRSTWYTPPKMEAERTNAVMGPDTFKEHVRRSQENAPKTVEEATTGRLHRDSTYDAYMRAMKEAGKQPTSPKSIDWGSYERGRDYSVDELKLIQSAEGKKVVMPNGKVLQSTWYRPVSLDNKMSKPEQERFKKNQAAYVKQQSEKVARQTAQNAPASNVAPETVHTAMQAAAKNIAGAIIDAGKAIREHGSGSPQEKAAVARVHAANAEAERVLSAEKSGRIAPRPKRTEEQRIERTRKAKLKRTMDSIAKLKADADARVATASGKSVTGAKIESKPTIGDKALATAAGLDAGNRSMKKGGRTAWNADDSNAASREHAKVMGKSAAQSAYEADVARRPTYDDGKPRKSWQQLGDVERSTWEKNPTPRDWREAERQRVADGTKRVGDTAKDRIAPWPKRTEEQRIERTRKAKLKRTMDSIERLKKGWSDEARAAERQRIADGTKRVGDTAKERGYAPSQHPQSKMATATTTVGIKALPSTDGKTNRYAIEEVHLVGSGAKGQREVGRVVHGNYASHAEAYAALEKGSSGKPAGWSDEARAASAEARKAPVGMDGKTRAERAGRVSKPAVSVSVPEGASNAERFLAHYTAELAARVQADPAKYRFGKDNVPERASAMVEGLKVGASDHKGAAVQATAKALGIKPTLGAIKAFLTDQPPPAPKPATEGLSAREMTATKRAIASGQSVKSDVIAKATNAQLQALDDAGLAARRAQTGNGNADWGKIRNIEAWREQIRDRARQQTSDTINPLSGNKKTMAMVDKAPKGASRKGAKVERDFKPVNPYEQVVKQAQGQRSVTMEQVAGTSDARFSKAEMRAALDKVNIWTSGANNTLGRDLKALSHRELMALGQANNIDTKGKSVAEIRKALGVAVYQGHRENTLLTEPDSGTRADASAKRQGRAVEKLSSGLRGTQNPENLKAIIENKQKNAKGEKPLTPRQAAAADYEKAFGKPPPKSMTANVMRSKIGLLDEQRSLTKATGEAVQAINSTPKSPRTPLTDAAKSAGIAIPDMSGQKPDRTPWEKLVAETEAAQKTRMDAGGSKPQRTGADTSQKTDYQKSLDQTGKRQTAYQGDPDNPGKPTGKSRNQLLAEARKKGIPNPERLETRSLASKLGYSLKYMLPVGIGAAALIAMNQSAEAGESGSKQALEGAKVAGTGAAVAAGFIGGSALAVKGLMRAGLAATPAGWAVQGALMAGGAVYGAVTAKPGERLEGAAKGAWDMSLPGALVNTGLAVKEAATSTRDRLQGTGPVRLTGEQQAKYDAASKRYAAMRSAAQAEPSDKQRGWSNAARIAAAQARGAAILPYGGDPSKGPSQWGPATTSGMTEAMRKRA